MVRKAFAALGAVLITLGLLATPASARLLPLAPLQTLTWTANNSVTAYASAPSTAVAGETTIVFENSEATGNTSGMSHTLTFDTTTEGYNHNVTLNVVANPFDPTNGRHEATVTLLPGKYRYFCAFPGHETMTGELIVTDGGTPDTTPPTVNASVTGQKDPQGNYIKSANVTLTATDTQSGVAKVEYKVDSGAWTAYTAPVTVSTLGAHMVHYRATDVAGNTSPEGMASFTIVDGPAEDKTPPTVTAALTGERDAQGNYLDVATVSLTATDAESGVASVEYQLDSGAWTAYTASVAVNTAGMHMFHYRATDRAGNTSPEGMSHFTVVKSDTTPPAASAAVDGTKDGDGNYVGKATVTVAATDAGSGVGTIEYKLDGGAWTAYAAPVPVTTTGAHTVTYRATDKAGNVSPEGTVTFTVVAGGDTTPPTVSAALTGDQDANWSYVGKATLTLVAADSGSGVASIEYKLDSGLWTVYTAPLVVTALGSHVVKYRATDVAGNIAAEQSGAFKVVQIGPRPDACPDSDLRETVIIGDVDSQVENIDIGNGCTINDVIDENAEYASHDSFVRHVKAVTAELVDNGVLASADRGRIVTAALESSVGGSPSSLRDSARSNAV
ncbi:OmpL47-type beta-barrel domain-containing protein [Amycolatopsis sp. NPDC059657]|uniref:OmpL47-type beta-barrel domain-containing protein n=1 Tax=Amycolatopsis sp. NPDC059657 TaxID=3346899 RepID=UPI00366F93F8